MYECVLTTDPVMYTPDRNPFGDMNSNAENATLSHPWEWTHIDRQHYVRQFHALSPIDGRLNGQAVKPLMLEYAKDVPTADLGKIWGLADMESVATLFLNFSLFFFSLFIVSSHDGMRIGWLSRC